MKISRESIAARILNGEHLFILNGHLIRVPYQWLSAHPGGALAILHFIGRDATDEVEAYHPKHVLDKMRAFSQGPVQLSEDGWVPLLPPICTGWITKLSPDGSLRWHNEANPDFSQNTPSSQILLVKKSDAPLTSSPSLASIQPPPTALSLKIQSQHSAAYKELHKRVIAAGLYQTRYIYGYGPEVARYILFALSSYLMYQHGLFFLSAVSLGFLWHQLTFTSHDLGHVGVTHSWHKDRLIAIFLADFIGGLSIGWWVHVCPFCISCLHHPSSTYHLDSRITMFITVRLSYCTNASGSRLSFYSRHQPPVSVCLFVFPYIFISHLFPSDPDIQHLPFFAITPAFFKSLYSTYYKRELTFDRFSRAVITLQHNLFYVIMSLARFNLYRLSYRHLWITRNEPSKARGGRWAWWLEVFALIGFFYWYGNVLRGCGSWKTGLMYLLVSNMVSSPLHVQVVLGSLS
jgi:delta8-fatty-acid desaturase